MPSPFPPLFTPSDSHPQPHTQPHSQPQHLHQQPILHHRNSFSSSPSKSPQFRSIHSGNQGQTRFSGWKGVEDEWRRWFRTHPWKPIPKLLWKLFRELLETGFFWLLQLGRFLIYVVCLMPAWYHLVLYYLTSKEVRLNIQYGPNERNYADIFIPSTLLSGRPRCPVVIFVSGGVWLIGYKGWITPVARLLTQFNIITVSLDYRNYPQGSMSEQLQDVDLGIDWTLRRIWKYGGDNQNVYLAGHSAGAHLASYVYCSKLIASQRSTSYLPPVIPASQSPTKKDSTSLSVPSASRSSQQQPHQHFHPHLTKWKSSQLKAFIGISGPYYIPSCVGNFHAQGLHRSLLSKIFGHSSLFAYYSPQSLLSRESSPRTPTSSPGPSPVTSPNLDSRHPHVSKQGLTHSQFQSHVQSDPGSPITRAKSRLSHSQSSSSAAASNSHGSSQMTDSGHCSSHSEYVGEEEMMRRERERAKEKARFYFMHGTADSSVPWSSSVEFHSSLIKKGFKSKLLLYHDKTHTDIVLEDLMNHQLEGAYVIRDIVHIIANHSNYTTNTHWDHYFQETKFDEFVPYGCITIREESRENDDFCSEKEADEIEKKCKNDELFVEKVQKKYHNGMIEGLEFLEKQNPLLELRERFLKDYELKLKEEDLRCSYEKDENEDEEDVVFVNNHQPKMIPTRLLNIATRVCPF